MISVVSLLLLEELSELRVSSSYSLLCILLLSELSCGQVTMIEHLSGLAALLLLDVIEVGVPEKAETAEGEQEVALACVVEQVGFVPRGEHSLVHVSERGLVTRLQSAIDPINLIQLLYILTQHIDPSWGYC